jgi:hypothetical protein
MPKQQTISEALPASLHDAIEIERDNLAKPESLLGCLAISMECESHSATGPYYPDVAQIAREMVRRSINGLDTTGSQSSQNWYDLGASSGVDK